MGEGNRYGWATALLEDAEPVEDAAVETMLVCRPDRWADAPYQYLANQKVLDLSFELESSAEEVVVSQRTDSLKTLGCTGAVVWDGAVVLGRCLEYWIQVGLISLPGMKVVEMGSGCGLTGCVVAALGADVVLTDQEERLGLLQRNVDANAHLFRKLDSKGERHGDPHAADDAGAGRKGKGGKRGKRGGLSKAPNARGGHSGGAVGSAEVCELDWESRDLSGFKPVDLVIATDCVFNELVVPPMVNAMYHLCLPESNGSTCGTSEQALDTPCVPTVVINCMEIRCAEVHETFLEEALEHFEVFRLPVSSFHEKYTHPRIVIYVMVLRA